MAGNVESRARRGEPQPRRRRPDWVIPGGKLRVVEEVFADKTTHLRPAKVTHEQMEAVVAPSKVDEKIIFQTD